MKKKTIVILSLIIAVTLVFAACADNSGLTIPKEQANADLPADATLGAAPNNAAAIVVMVINGKEIYKDQYDNAYSTIASQYGLSEEDSSYAVLIQQSAIDLLISEQTMLQKIEELGYMNLTDEEMAEAQEQAQAELDYVTSTATDTIIAGLPENYTDDELQTATTAYEDMILAKYGFTRESFLEYFIQAIAVENARAELLKDIIPSDDEVLAQYNNTVEADKEAIGSDLSVYDGYLASYKDSYYIPEGVRYVKHVLITLSDEQTSAISTARSDEGDEAANKLREEALLTIADKANEVLTKLQNDEISFTDAVTEYGQDPGMEYYPDGYEVYNGCTLYVQEFTDGAMALKNVGDISGLIATDYGYHIIEYTSDRAAGPIPFESVQQSIYDSLVTTVQDEAWQAMLSEWAAAADYTVYEDKL